MFLSLLLLAFLLDPALSIRVLFVGNSFTYVNDLPGTLEQIAHSLEKEVIHNSSTIGGCTLYYQFPDDLTTELLQEEWDFIVLQDFSEMCTVKQARDTYFYPALENFVRQKRNAKIVLYNTWGYYNGSQAECPTSDNAKCFPKGSLASMTSPPCDSDPTWHNSVNTFDCMSYSVSRGYLSGLERGGDMVVPCGEAWQVARMSSPSSSATACQLQVDAQYSAPMPISLPLPGVIAAGDTSDIMLYRQEGRDKHPSVAGQYLNALCFYAMLFKESPVGAINLSGLSDKEARALQLIAESVTLHHMDVWSR